MINKIAKCQNNNFLQNQKFKNTNKTILFDNLEKSRSWCHGFTLLEDIVSLCDITDKLNQPR